MYGSSLSCSWLRKREPGEWNVYSDVAGIWSLWRPTTLLVRRDGQSFRVDHGFDVYLPRGRPWRVLVWTRECDYGSFGGEGTTQPLAPCPKNGEFGVRAGNTVPVAVSCVVLHFQAQASMRNFRAFGHEFRTPLTNILQNAQMGIRTSPSANDLATLIGARGLTPRRPVGPRRARSPARRRTRRG